MRRKTNNKTIVIPVFFFQLTDVMVDTDPFKTQLETTETVSQFNRTTKISLKGKFGAELSKEIIGT